MPLKETDMFGAFARAFDQLSDPKIRAVIWKSAAGTIIIYVGLLTAIGWALANTSFFEIAWVEATVDLFGGLAAVLLAVILFPGVMTALASALLEDVADAVEASHYPSLGTARALNWLALIGSAARLLGMTVFLNLLVLPLYLIPGVNLAVYYGLNGYLISREYFEVVAYRRLDPDAVPLMRRRYSKRLWLMGAVTTFFLTIPGLNLIAPVIGTAAMVHLFHTLNGGHDNRSAG